MKRLLNPDLALSEIEGCDKRSVNALACPPESSLGANVPIAEQLQTHPPSVPYSSPVALVRPACGVVAASPVKAVPVTWDFYALPFAVFTEALKFGWRTAGHRRIRPTF